MARRSQACVRNDLLLGFPAGQESLMERLGEHVMAPDVEWGME
jgi:hypothetical protein